MFSRQGFQLLGCSIRNVNKCHLMQTSSVRLRHFDSTSRVEGLSTAPVTPFKNNGEINYGIFDKYVDHLIRMKINNAYVLGTTAEAVSLTLEERKLSAEAWMAAGKDKLSSIMVHVGTNSIRDSQELARHAESVGAHSIAAMPPVYYKPKTEEELLYFMKEVAAAAPNTPFYFYDINFMTGVNLSMPRFLKLVDGVIPTFRGLKHSSKELDSLYNCMMYENGKYDIIFGTHFMYIYALAIGVTVPITTSYLGPIFYRMREAFLTGDLETARKEQWRTQQLINIRNKHGYGYPQIKTILGFLGLDMGPCRLPLQLPTTAQAAALRKDLEEVGFFKWIE